jgi:hypothetical protein
LDINTTNITNISSELYSTDINSISTDIYSSLNITSELIIDNSTSPEINDTINSTSINTYINTTIDESSNIAIIDLSSEVNHQVNLSQMIQTQNNIDIDISTTVQMTSDISRTDEIIKTSSLSITEKATEIETKHYAIFVLQVQIINSILNIFIITDFNVAIGMKFTFEIEINEDTSNLRFLQNRKQIINAISDKNYSSNELITLKSEENIDEDDVTLTEAKINISQVEDDGISITSVYNNKEMLNTKLVAESIQNNKSLDFSNSNLNITINIYKIESATSGCNFNLKCKNSIKSNNKKIDLTFTRQSTTLIANCDLKNSEDNINCNINKAVQGNYALQAYRSNSMNEIFAIIQESNSGLYLSCALESLFEKLKKKIGLGGVIGLFFGIIIGGTLIIFFISYVICRNGRKVYKKYKKGKFFSKRKNKGNDNVSIDSNSIIKRYYRKE